MLAITITMVTSFLFRNSRNLKEPITLTIMALNTQETHTQAHLITLLMTTTPLLRAHRQVMLRMTITRLLQAPLLRMMSRDPTDSKNTHFNM